MRFASDLVVSVVVSASLVATVPLASAQSSGDILIFEELMDSNSLFLTANADPFDDGVLWSHAARGCQSRQLDSDRPEKGLVYDTPPRQPAPAVLRQVVATERD